jgi:hypothetical protein
VDAAVWGGDSEGCRLPIDNNETEQLMKQVAIGRKNWLFLGSVAAGERLVDLLTVVPSAERNDLDVWAYVKDVLDRLLAGRTRYAALRPGAHRELGGGVRCNGSRARTVCPRRGPVGCVTS